MLSYLKQRAPWPAAIIAFVLSPAVGLLYLGRGRLAFGYFFAGLTCYMLDNVFGLPTTWALHATGAAHAFKLAKRPYQAKPYSSALAIVSICIAPIAAVMLARMLVYDISVLQNDSMHPAITAQDAIFVNKLAYLSTAPARGDIISFKHDNATWLKRIAALPGETVEITHKRIIITRQDTSHITIANTGMYGQAVRTVTLPPDEYFVLGDNLTKSLDSRSIKIGTIARGDIIGKASRKLWNRKTKQVFWAPAL